MEKILRKAHKLAGLPYSYCEFYGSEKYECLGCNKIPCASKCAFQKNHDFGLGLPVSKDSNYVVLYREDFVDQMEAYYRYRNHVDEVVPDRYHDFVQFCRRERSYYQGFVDKWVKSHVPNRVVIEYGRLLENPEYEIARAFDLIGLGRDVAAEAVRSVPIIRRPRADHEALHSALSQDAKIVLLVGFYKDANAKRNDELRECLRRNLANPFIGQVRAFLEDEAARPEWAEFAPNPKAMLVEHGRRCTFQDFFRYSNTNLTGITVIFANADIWFDHTIDLSRKIGSDVLAAISRYDYWKEYKNTPSGRGQDAWIFRPPMRDFVCNWELGRAHCDKRIAAEARIAGLIVKNPSLDIKAYHLHATMLRRRAVRTPVRGRWYIPPCTRI